MKGKKSRRPNECEVVRLDPYFERELSNLERCFNDGNLGALARALQSCADYKIPIPAWLSGALQQLIQEKAEGAPKKKMGRHSRFSTQQDEKLRDVLRYEAVWNAAHQGFKGQKKYVKANEFLRANEFSRRMGAPVNEDDPSSALKKSATRFNKNVAKNPAHYSFFAVRPDKYPDK